MQVQTTNIKDILIFEPTIFSDDRGAFFESFNQQTFNKLLKQHDNCAQNVNFVQDNHSISEQYVLRGLHYQIKNAQSKLVRVIKGLALDVAVDIRVNSPSFGQHVAIELSESNNKQLWIPAGFAHGFIALSDKVEFLYKVTDYRYSEFERTIIWNDSNLAINWQIPSNISPILSNKDEQGINLESADLYIDDVYCL